MTQTVTLRIVGENGQLVGVIRASKTELDGLGKSATSAGAQAARGARQVDELGNASERTRRRATMLGGTLGQIKTLLGGLFIAQTLQDLGRLGDTYSDINGKLKQVSASERELATARAETFRISQQYFQQWDATAQLWTRAAMTSDTLRNNQEKLGNIIETVSASLLVNRASTAEAASAMLQLSQSIGSGVLRGEEFRAVYEAAPQLMQLLAESMGKPIGALKELAEEGELTIDEMIKAWTGPNAQKIIDAASEVPLTIGRAWQNLRNDVLRRLGEIDQALGITGGVATGIAQLPTVFGAIGKAAGVLALILAGRLAGSLATTTRAFFANQVAATQAYLATMRLNTGMGTMPALLARVGAGVRGLGAGLLSFAGGPVGVAVIAVGALIAKFVSARAEARQLRQEVAQAIDASNQFLDTNDLNQALVAGKSLLARRQELQDFIAERAATITGISAASPLAAEAYKKVTGTDQEIINASRDLDEVNRRLALNAQRIAEVTARQEARTAATEAGTAESAEFNEALAEQNEKLKIERIEREQGIRAALEYQAMQAAGVTSVAQLSQATRDLIDTQVQEVSAAQAYKEAQKAAERASRDAAKATDEQRKAQAEYADQLALARAELEGPLAVAQVEHDQAVRAINKAYADGNILIDDRNGLLDVERQKLEQTTATITAKRNILAQIVGDYTEQIRLSGLSAQAYRVEEELQRRVNDAREAGVEVTAELKAQWRDAIAAGEDQLAIADAARRAAEEFEGTWLNAVQSVGRAFGDWVTGSISSLGDLRDTLVDIGKRWFSDLFARGFTRLLNGGFADAGGSGGGGLMGWLANMGGNSGGGLLGGIARMMGFQPGAAATGMGWGNAAVSRLAGGAGFLGMPAGAGASPFTAAGAAQAMGGAGGNFSTLGSLFGISKDSWLAGSFANGTPYLGAALGAGGLYYGLTQRGNGGLSSGLAGLSYGAAGLAAGGALAGGIAGTGAMAGASGAFASLGAASWIPVVGWVLAAAALVDMVSGGKLFGTKFKPESSAMDLAFGPDGASGRQEVVEVRNRSLFRGREWRTRSDPLKGEAKAAVDQVFDDIRASMIDAARQLGVEAPEAVAATFRAEYDKNGKLTRESGTIAGRRYNEDQETFFTRYGLENLLAVAKAVGSASEIEQLAGGYRGSVDALKDFTTLVLAIQGDLSKSIALWEDSEGALTRVVSVVESMRQGGESLADTYARVMSGARQYGQLIAGVRGELLTRDLSDFARAQLDVELQYRAQVKSANELAKALGLSGARAEDLAAIEQLRAVRMADLQQQMERQRDEFLGNLRLSELGPGTDRSKLADAMGQLQAAVAAGDMQRAQQLSQTALGFGRNLFASGSDYNALYGQVTGLLQQLDPADSGLTSDALQQLADTMETLPNDIAAALFGLLQGQTPTPPPPAPGRPGLPDRPRNPKLDRDPAGEFGRGNDALLERMASGIDTLVRQVEQRDTSDRLRQRNQRGALVP